MPVSDWVPFPRQVPRTRPHARAFMALLTLAGMLAQLISGYHNFEIGLYLKILFGLQLPDYLLFARARPRRARAWWTRSTSVTWWRSSPTLHRPPRRCSESSTTCSSTAAVRGGPTPRCAASVRRSGRGCGSSSTGPRGHCCSPWRRGCSGCAAGRAASDGGSSGAPSLHSPHGMDRRGGYRARPHAGRLHLLQHERAERVPQRLRPRGPAAPSTSGATDGTQASRSPGWRAPTCASRSIPNGVRWRSAARTAWRTAATSRSTPSTWPRPPRSRPPRSPSIGRLRTRSWTRTFTTGSTPSSSPLLPGHSLRLDFEVRVASRGFRESGVDTSVVANGTYFTSGWLPAIGYQSQSRARERQRPARARARSAPADLRSRRRRSAEGSGRWHRLRSGGGHQRGSGCRRARCAPPDMDGRRPPLLPLCDRCADWKRVRHRLGQTTRCAKHSGTRRRRSGSSITRNTRQTSTAWFEASGPPSTTTPGSSVPIRTAISLRRASRQRRGNARRGQHDHVHRRGRPLGIERRSREPRSSVRGRRTRDGPPVDGPVCACRGCPGDVGEPCLVLRDEGRGARQGDRGSFGGF